MRELRRLVHTATRGAMSLLQRTRRPGRNSHTSYSVTRRFRKNRRKASTVIEGFDRPPWPLLPTLALTVRPLTRGNRNRVSVYAAVGYHAPKINGIQALSLFFSGPAPEFPGKRRLATMAGLLQTRQETSMTDTDFRPTRLISLQEACRRAGISRAALYEKISSGSSRYDPTFPVPVKVDSRTRFVEIEIERWVQNKLASRNERAASAV